MSNSFAYSKEYHPPAPIVSVTVKAESDQELTALVDSGSDATILSIATLQEIGAKYVMSQRMMGVTGNTVEIDLYTVEINICSYSVPGIHAIGMEILDEAIIGRDVLNQLIVTLDGIGGVTDVG